MHRASLGLYDFTSEDKVIQILSLQTSTTVCGFRNNHSEVKISVLLKSFDPYIYTHLALRSDSSVNAEKMPYLSTYHIVIMGGDLVGPLNKVFRSNMFEV